MTIKRGEFFSPQHVYYKISRQKQNLDTPVLPGVGGRVFLGVGFGGGVGDFVGGLLGGSTSFNEYVLLILPQCIWMLSVDVVRSRDITSV